MDKITKVIEKSEFNRMNYLKKAYQLMSEGVLIHDPHRIDIRGELICGKGVQLDVNVIIEGEVILEDDVIIGANCILRNCRINKGSIIKPFSIIEDSFIGNHCFIGPYARLRPKTSIENHVQIGNFVETKNANIGSNCRINHLSFIGDADLQENVTIGAGTITCNHDGHQINKTIIKKGAYIGSGSNLIAPLLINSNATIASGSSITDDVPGDSLTIARSKQVTIKNWNGPKSSK